MADNKKKGGPNPDDMDIDSLLESAGLVGSPESLGDEDEAGRGDHLGQPLRSAITYVHGRLNRR